MIKVTRQGRGPRMLGMMGVILGSAIGFGAIKSPTIFGGQAVVVCTIATLLVASFGAILCTPKAFWFGLAAAGWASMLLAAEFWFADSPHQPNLLGAAIFASNLPAQYQDSFRRFEFGMPQYRAIVFGQIALVQGLIGGLVGYLLTRGRLSVLRRFGRLRSMWFPIFLMLVATWIALRFCETIAAIVYVQAVTIALVAATMGGFVGSHRAACAGAALLGWATLFWNVYGPAPKHADRPLWAEMVGTNPWNGTIEDESRPNIEPIGITEKLYMWSYPQLLNRFNAADLRSESWNTWHWRIFGDPPDLRKHRWDGGGPTPWALDHFRRFSLVAAHAAALFAMTLGALASSSIRRRPDNGATK